MSKANGEAAAEGTPGIMTNPSTTRAHLRERRDAAEFDEAEAHVEQAVHRLETHIEREGSSSS